MAGAIWVHGETTADGALARISDRGRDARPRRSRRRPGAIVVGVVVAADPGRRRRASSRATSRASSPPRDAGDRGPRRGHDRRPSGSRD